MTFMERVRCLLYNSRLLKSFWANTIVIAYFLVNFSLSMVIDKKTLKKVWSGTLANYTDLKIFGCSAYAHIDNGKLEPRIRKCVFLRYMSGIKGYKL